MDKRRGRPLGFRLSEESKRAISDSKKGQKHSEATKEKISRTLISYFRNVYPLSSELLDNYAFEIESSKEVREWFDRVRQTFNETEDVFTERSLNSKRFREISIEYNISMEDNPYANRFMTNPEDIYELQDQCTKLGFNFNEVCFALGIMV